MNPRRDRTEEPGSAGLFVARPGLAERNAHCSRCPGDHRARQATIAATAKTTATSFDWLAWDVEQGIPEALRRPKGSGEEVGCVRCRESGTGHERVGAPW
jgi:hypothetical protein